VRDRRVPAGRLPAAILASALGVALWACSSTPTATSGPVPTGAASTGAAPTGGAPATVIPAPSPGGASPAVSVNQLSEGRWTAGGEIHVDIAGGYEGGFDLPLMAGDTAAGRTTLTFQRQDPGDTTWSLGLVRISFFPGADSIGIEAGGLRVQGPCTITLASVSDDHLAGEIACGEDLQASVEGDPREMTISGSFDASR
jgi:hypothetical protein